MTTSTRSLDDITTPRIAEASRQAARSILSAVDEGLDGVYRSAFLWDCSLEPSGVLLSIADTFRSAGSDSRVEVLALSLYAEARFFGGVHAIQTLGDSEPWLTVRRGLWDIVAVIDDERGPGPWCTVTRQHSVREIPRP